MAKQTVIIEYKGDVDDLIKSLNKTAKSNVKVSKGASKVGKDYEKATKKAVSANERLGKSINKVGSIIGTAFAVSSIIQFGKASLALYDQQAKAEQGLLVALKGRKKAQESLIRQAQKLQKTTLFGDEETIKAQSLIAAFVQEESQIKRIIPLVQDLATAKGMDLAGAADLVSKTLGSSTNALSRYGIQVEGAVGSSQRLESLAKGLSDAFGGQAEAAAKAGTGGVTQLANRWGDLSEKFGEFLIKNSGPVLDFFDSLLTKLEDSIEGIDGLVDSLDDLSGASETQAKEQTDILKGIRDRINAEEDLKKVAVESLKEQKKRVVEAQKERNKALEDLNLLTQEEKNILGFTNDEIKEKNDELKAQAELKQRLVEQEIELFAKLENTFRGQSDFNDLLKEFGLEQKKVNKEVEKFIDLSDEIREEAGLEVFNSELIEKQLNEIDQIRAEFEEENLDFLDEQIQAEIKKNKRIQEEERKHQDELNRIRKDQAFATFKEVENLLIGLADIQFQEELTRLDEQNTIEQAKLKQQLDAKLLTQDQYNTSVQELNENLKKQEDEIRRDQAELNKKISLFDATINTAVAVTKAFTVDPTGILAALTAIAGAAQIALISQQPIPQFEQGGLIGGKRHKHGGTLIEAEKGEWITNRLMTKKYHKELEAINSNRFDDLLMTKYIMPAIAQHKKAEQKAFDDWNLLNSDKKTQRLLLQIAQNTSNNNRINRRYV